MIAGRPVSLWLGLITALSGLVTAGLVAAGLDPVLVANLVGPAVTALGALIVLIANQPPTLAPGDNYKISTPQGTPNYEATVAPPPAPTKPTVDPE